MPSSFFLVGSETLLVQCAEVLLDRGHIVSGIATDNETIRNWAWERDIEVQQSIETIPDTCSGTDIDYLFSIGNLKILPDAVLEIPKRLAINFHDGPLPSYVGLNTPTWALINGESSHGVSWHVVTSSVDRGDILESEGFEIQPDETSLTINMRCYEAGLISFQRLVEALEADKLTAVVQTEQPEHTYRRSDRPWAAGAIDLGRSAKDICRFVRALDFGPYRNPLAVPHLLTEHGAVLVRSAEDTGRQSDRPPGAAVTVGDDWIEVCTATSNVRLSGLATPSGEPLSPADAQSILLPDGNTRFELPPNIDDIAEACRASANHEPFWTRQLAQATKAAGSQPVAPANDTAVKAQLPVDTSPLVNAVGGDAECAAVAAVAAFFAANGVGTSVSLDVAAPVGGHDRQIPGLFAPDVPLNLEVDPDLTFVDFATKINAILNDFRSRGPFLSDLALRERLQTRVGSRFGVYVGDHDNGGGSHRPQVRAMDAASWEWWGTEDSERADAATRFVVFLNSIVQNPHAPLREANLLDAEVVRQIVSWNDTGVPFDPHCIHEYFERQVSTTPDSIAMACGTNEVTYAELNARANRVAFHLRSKGVGPETLVAINMRRSIEMMVCVLGVLKAGGAYLPLDPEYPEQRLDFMLEDSGARFVITDSRVDRSVFVSEVLDYVSLAASSAEAPGDNLPAPGPETLAYVIYTSGSTGSPKGVMVEHRNVANFFEAMDRCIDYPPGSVWLSVTSLSFDISVLELFWTLVRGFKVVLYTQPGTDARETTTRHPEKGIDFSLFFWNTSTDEGDGAPDKYRLLVEASKFADRNLFSAVWTPERHFHSFGGLYPNPSLTSALIAGVTDRVRIRSGSCVIPLHHPIRVAEDWAVVDNLSNGRVDLGIATGWQPNDFVLKPENHADRKAVAYRYLDQVRRLWRGEALEFPGPDGSPVEIRTLPRPIQPELNVWVAIAGNPESYVQAARAGANVLTHLLGQTLDEVAEKIAIYRKTWRESGWPGSGFVTLMLHTFVAETDEIARNVARDPMKGYLATATELVRQAAWHFPTFQEMSGEGERSLDDFFDHASENDLDDLLEFAFNRYFGESGLFGSHARAIETIDRAKEIGVDEIGCLVDYGIAADTVLEGLTRLDKVRRASNPAAHDVRREETVAELIERHAVTHMQCTPSLLSMIVDEPDNEKALGSLCHIMVGGEAFPPALARRLTEQCDGRITNMYGPTETTIWSTVQDLEGDSLHTVPIGKPIANTQCYVVGPNLEPVTPGQRGELVIGGAGVVRGYLGRGDLTAVRFIKARFRGIEEVGRVYRTGDLVSQRPDGTIEFHGRLDNQVKLRGYRIEPGEIESVVGLAESVKEVAVALREDAPGGAQLVAYVSARDGKTIDTADIKENSRNRLPEFMVPAIIVVLEELPRTPNGKIDRNALPVPLSPHAVSGAHRPDEQPGTELEEFIAGLWRRVLNVPDIGIDDNFFDIGGHSLLVVQILNSLRKKTGQPIPMTDLFRFPTIRSIANHLAAGGASDDLSGARDRATSRKEAAARRRKRPNSN